MQYGQIPQNGNLSPTPRERVFDRAQERIQAHARVRDKRKVH